MFFPRWERAWLVFKASFYVWSSNVSIWRFSKMVVPPNHSLKWDRIFHCKPSSFWVPPQFRKSLYVSIYVGPLKNRPNPALPGCCSWRSLPNLAMDPELSGDEAPKLPEILNGFDVNRRGKKTHPGFFFAQQRVDKWISRVDKFRVSGGRGSMARPEEIGWRYPLKKRMTWMGSIRLGNGCAVNWRTNLSGDGFCCTHKTRDFGDGSRHWVYHSTVDSLDGHESRD